MCTHNRLHIKGLDGLIRKIAELELGIPVSDDVALLGDAVEFGA